MWYYKPTDELYHYGVKGMKWGRRRKYSLLPSQGVQTYGRVPVTSFVGKNDAYAGRTPNQIQRVPNRPIARPKTVGGVSNGIKVTGSPLTREQRGKYGIGNQSDEYGHRDHPVVGGNEEHVGDRRKEELAKKRIEKLLKKKKERSKRKAEKIYLNNLK